MAKKGKKHTKIEYHRAFLVQLEDNLDQFIGKCKKLNIEDPNEFNNLIEYVEVFVEDVLHYIKNFKITANIVNVDENGKPLLRGNQAYVNELEFFLEHAKQTDPKKSRPFIPYKEFVQKVTIENARRSKTGEEPLHDIAEITYTSWKSQCKPF